MKESFKSMIGDKALDEKAMKNQFIQYLKKHSHIPAEDETLVAEAMQAKHYKEGDYLFKEGKVCSDLFFVCNGILRISGTSDQGNEVTYFFVAENHLCTIMLSFTNRVPATDNIIAACDADVLVVSYKALQELYTQVPYLQNTIQQIQHQAFMQKIAIRNHYLSHEDATSRYKLFIEQMPTVATRVSLTSIASYLGITPQSLSRIRRSLK